MTLCRTLSVFLAVHCFTHQYVCFAVIMPSQSRLVYRPPKGLFYFVATETISEFPECAIQFDIPFDSPWQLTFELLLFGCRIGFQWDSECSYRQASTLHTQLAIAAGTITRIYAGFINTAGCLSLGHMAQCVVHALKGLACRARATPACSPASHCKQCTVLTSPLIHARGCATPSRTH